MLLNLIWIEHNIVFLWIQHGDFFLNLVELNHIKFKLVEFKLIWIPLNPTWIQIGFNWIIFIILLSWIQPNNENPIMRKHMLIWFFIST